MTLDVIPPEACPLTDADGIGPEHMVALCTEGSQARYRILYRGGFAGIGRVGQDAREGVFRQRTGGPSVLTIISKPRMRGFMVHMGGVK